MNLVQIGSGSADLDENFSDGFTNFAKGLKNKKNIFIIEANSLHLKSLKKSWKNEKNIKIFNLAITPDNYKNKKITFYYCSLDTPNYQIFSNSYNFVKRHFKYGIIKSKIVDAMCISVFLKKFINNNVDYLSLDIEGLDFDVIYHIKLNKIKILNISFEHIHLSFFQKVLLISKLVSNGYLFSGMGFDLRKSDWMFTKELKKGIVKTILLPFTPRRIWKNYKFHNFNN